MITAVDTSVLIDVFGADTEFGPRSKNAVGEALSAGRLVACDIVWAEVAGVFPSAPEAQRALKALAVGFDALSEAAALSAGAAWLRYRRAGGTRTRLVTDFLVGAHALTQADQLVTRDRGFFRTYFEDLAIVDPTT